MKFNLHPANPSRPTSIIQLHTFIDSKRVKIGTGVTVTVKDWDSKRQRINTRRDKTLIALQNELDNTVQAIVNLHDQLVVNDGVELTADALRDGVKRMRDGKVGVAEKVLTFNQWVDEFIEETANGHRTNQQGQVISERTVKKYRTVQRQLHEFIRKVWGRPIRFDEIDERFLNAYTKFRRDQGLGINTIAKDTAVLKTWMKTAFTREVHSNRKWEADFFKPKEVAVQKPHLTIEELAILEAAKYPTRTKYGRDITAIHDVRDMFVLACWTGARISDVKRFPAIVAEAWKQNGNQCPIEITFVQAKTNAAVTVPILEGARRIIEKHAGQLPKLPSEQKMNATIKQAVKDAGIDRVIELPSTDPNDKKSKRVPIHELITNHTARRTFATNVYNMDILSLGELMALTGHESESSLMTYLNVTRTDVSKRASAKLREAFAS